MKKLIRKTKVKVKNITRKVMKMFSNLGTLNIILIVVGVFLFWFVRKMCTMYFSCGSIPETFACCVLTCCIGEAGICARIRTTKNRIMEHKWEDEIRKIVQEQQPQSGNQKEEEVNDDI